MMETFISGVIKDNKPGAVLPTFEGDTVWDRWLILEYGDSEELEIFDPGCISEELKVGEHYQVIVAVEVFKNEALRFFPSLPSEKSESLRQGKVLSLNWQPSLEFSVANDGFKDSEWCLIETLAGLVIIDPKHLTNIAPSVEVGGYLRWEPSRWDLCAVI